MYAIWKNILYEDWYSVNERGISIWSWNLDGFPSCIEELGHQHAPQLHCNGVSFCHHGCPAPRTSWPLNGQIASTNLIPSLLLLSAMLSMSMRCSVVCGPSNGGHNNLVHRQSIMLPLDMFPHKLASEDTILYVKQFITQTWDFVHLVWSFSL